MVNKKPPLYNGEHGKPLKENHSSLIKKTPYFIENYYRYNLVKLRIILSQV